MNYSKIFASVSALFSLVDPPLNELFKAKSKIGSPASGELLMSIARMVCCFSVDRLLWSGIFFFEEVVFMKSSC